MCSPKRAWVYTPDADAVTGDLMPTPVRRRLVLWISCLLLAGLLALVGWIFWTGAHERLFARGQFDHEDVRECAEICASLSEAFPDRMARLQQNLEQLPERERVVFYRIERTSPTGSVMRHEWRSGEWQTDSAVWSWDAQTTVGRVRFTPESGGPVRPAVQYYHSTDSLKVFVILLER